MALSARGIAVVACAILLTAVAGLLAADHGSAALLVVIIPVGGYLMLKRPFIGLLLFIATIPLELAFVASIGEGVTVTRIAGLAMAVPWFVGKLFRGESFSAILRLALSWIALLFLTWVLLSVTWAEVVPRAQIGVVQLAQLVTLAVIVIDVVSDPEDFDWCIRVFTVSLIITACLLLYDYWVGGARRAGEDLAGVNGTAELLVTFVPFGFYLIQWGEKFIWKLIGGILVVATVVALPVTLSRMAFLMLPFALFAGLWEVARSRRARGWLALILIGGLMLGGAFVPTGELKERVATIGPYLESTFDPDAGPTVQLSGRGYHLAVGLAIFRDHPLKGVGYNNYGEYFLRDYQFEVPGAGGAFWQQQRSPHSSHVGILADLGLIGFAIWVMLLATCFVYLYRSFRWSKMWGFGSVGGKSRALARVCGYALFIQALPYALHGPNQKAKHLWLLVGLIGALYLYCLQRADAKGVGASKAAAKVNPGSG